MCMPTHIMTLTNVSNSILKVIEFGKAPNTFILECFQHEP